MDFRKKLVIPIAFLIFLSLSILGIAIYFNTQSAFENQLIVQLEDQLKTVELNINSRSKLSQDIKNEIGVSHIPIGNTIAKLIYNDQSLLNTESLAKLSKELGIDELSIYNEFGVATHANLESSIGYDLSSDEQSIPFLEFKTLAM